MRLLVLGGTHFVGRALAEAGLARGDEVTTLNRGVSGSQVPGTEALVADRLVRDELTRVLDGRSWDAVVDTWSSDPAVVETSAELLAGRVGHYGYVSSASVYRWPIPRGADETTPTVDVDAAEEGDYAANKRGGELAVLRHLDGRALLARAGLIIGPAENVGRLPWWLRRVERGGRVPAPGSPDQPLQLIDARDLARWMLDSADRGLSGAFNALSRRGNATMGQILETALQVTGSDAELVWTTPEQIEAAGVEPWTELPLWAPPTGELAALHDIDVDASHAEGLRCRPIAETVVDTWAWMQTPSASTSTPPRAAVGLDADAERRLLAQAGV